MMKNKRSVMKNKPETLRDTIAGYAIYWLVICCMHSYQFQVVAIHIDTKNYSKYLSEHVNSKFSGVHTPYP